MTETTTPTTADLRRHRQETREKADGIAWTLDRLKRQQFDKVEKAEMRRIWGAADDEHLRRILAQHVVNLRVYADRLAEDYPDAFDPILTVEGVIAKIDAGDADPEALAAELRFVAAELRSKKPVTYVR